jgi:DNA polymerase III delta prime subunit
MAQRQLTDWLRTYGEYTANNEAATVFHIWTSLGVIAGAAQRKIFMKSKHFPVFSNMYLLFVSPPGRGKKTTAMRIGKEILAAVEPKVNFATESGSYEALVGTMAKIPNPAHQSMTLFSSELGTLMKTNTAAMVDFLTDIYDCNPNWTRDTVAHAKQVIARPWLNIIGGTTPSWLAENIGVVAIEGGLTARCIIPYSDKRILKNAWDEEEPLDAKTREALIHDLSIIATLEGQFRFDPEALEVYKKWYYDESRFPVIADPRTASYFDREHIHLLKVAMVLSLSYKDDLILLAEDIKRALALLEATKPGMRLALSAVGKNEWASAALHVLAQIRASGQLSYAKLLIANFHNLGKKNLDTTLEELRISGRVRSVGGMYGTWEPIGTGTDD